MIYSKINSRAIGIIASSIVAGVLIGCGGGGGDSTATTPPTSSVPTGAYTVSVIDDNVVGATVSAPECATFSSNGGGSYTLKECIAAPSTIIAVGGFVDVDGDGTQDADEASQTAPLMLKVSQSGLTNNFAVTPLSTLASQETDLAGLASALGVTQADLFQDNAANRNLMRSVNAVLISAREAGITKYDEFVADLKDQIKAASGTTAIDRLAAAKTYMANHLATYKAKYGVVFGGFVDDTSTLDLAADPLKAVKTANTATNGKVRLGGFVYDAEIPSAAITIYDGTTIVGTGTSASTGRYQIEIDDAVLASSKVLRFEAVAGTTKLIAYLTTDELRAGKFGSKVSSGTVEDLIISNVTTAKAVLVDKLAATASGDAAKMVQTKAVVEAMYGQDILAIASSIKAVIDYNAPLAQSDTLALAQAVAAGSQTAETAYTSTIQNDPLLSGQLNSTTSSVTAATSMRSVITSRTFYEFDYNYNFAQNPFTYGTIAIANDGSDQFKSYKYDGTNWIVYENDTSPAGAFQWSSDGNTMFMVGDADLPAKITLLSKETVTYNGISADLYFIRHEVTADGTEGFFTNFAATAEAQGTYDPISQNGFLTYSDGGTEQFYMPSATSITRYGKTFYVAQWTGGDRSIYYIDSNNNIYKKSYDPIGTVEVSWMTDSVALLAAWKNMDQTQKDGLTQAITSSGSYYDWAAIQRIIYDAIIGAM